MNNSKALERLIWSIAFPGFGQLLNGRLLKGAIFILLEVIINMNANINSAIIASFHGDMTTAIQVTNYQWLLNYSCVYLFAIWDSYKDAGGGKEAFSFLPFVFSAFFGTIGVIYSPTLRIAGALIGPIFLPIIFLIVGALVGIIIKISIIKLLLRKDNLI